MHFPCKFFPQLFPDRISYFPDSNGQQICLNIRYSKVVFLETVNVCPPPPLHVHNVGVLSVTCG